VSAVARFLSLDPASSLVKIDVDPRGVFAREFTELEKKNLEFAARMAANATGFAIREQWKDKAASVFDRPTELTKRAALVQKATKDRPFATVFLRDESASVPPAKYLLSQALGGVRRHKAFERRLIDAGILPSNQYAVPGKGEPLDGFGNIPGSRLNAILSQLRARFDPKQNETATSAARRRRREAKLGQRRGEIFAVRPGKPNNLPPGVYQRVGTAYGSAVKSVLAFVKPPSYQVRYDIFGYAKGIYTQQFPFHFENELVKAVQTSKFRGRA
jgi:hypothetical protein